MSLREWRATLALTYGALRILAHRLWVRYFGSSAPEPIDWRERRILLLGLDKAGKTSLVRRACDATAVLEEKVPPTSGFAVKTATFDPDWKCELWEVGGAAAMRQFWPRYATGVVDALAWVVDGADASRLAESALALLALLRDAWLLRTRPLLVLVSKAELGGALDADAVAAGLGLPALAAQGLVRGTPKVLQVSAVDGRNLADGFRWCCEGGVEVERT